MAREGSARGRAGARHDVEHTGREPHGRRELRELQGAKRREGCRLQHDGVPRSEGGRNPAAREDEGIVPRGDVARDTDRLPHRVIEPLAGDGDRIPLDLVREARVVLEELVHVGDVPLRFTDRLADVLRLDSGEVLEPITDRLAELEEEPPALARVDAPPLRILEGRARRVHGRIDIVLATGRHLGDRTVRGGVEDRRKLAAGGLGPLPSDEHQLLWNVHRGPPPPMPGKHINVRGVSRRVSLGEPWSTSSGGRGGFPHSSISASGTG